MKCPRCRKNIPDDSIFCPECGVKIRQTGFPQSGGNYAAPQKKKFPVAVAVAAVAGVAVIAGGAVYAVKTDRIALPGALSAKQKQLDDMSVGTDLLESWLFYRIIMDRWIVVQSLFTLFA